MMVLWKNLKLCLMVLKFVLLHTWYYKKKITSLLIFRWINLINTFLIKNYIIINVKIYNSFKVMTKKYFYTTLINKLTPLSHKIFLITIVNQTKAKLIQLFFFFYPSWKIIFCGECALEEKIVDKVREKTPNEEKRDCSAILYPNDRKWLEVKQCQQRSTENLKQLHPPLNLFNALNHKRIVFE